MGKSQKSKKELLIQVLDAVEKYRNEIFDHCLNEYKKNPTLPPTQIEENKTYIINFTYSLLFQFVNAQNNNIDFDSLGRFYKDFFDKNHIKSSDLIIFMNTLTSTMAYLFEDSWISSERVIWSDFLNKVLISITEGHDKVINKSENSRDPLFAEIGHSLNDYFYNLFKEILAEELSENVEPKMRKEVKSLVNEHSKRSIQQLRQTFTTQASVHTPRKREKNAS